MLAGAETLAETGADVIDVADSPMARMRMSPWAACRLIQEHVGIETVLHFPTRGRNLLRLQGDLLAVHALGIRNLLVCMGDPMAVGDYPGGTDTVDVAPTGLLSLITDAFNRGRGGGLGVAVAPRGRRAGLPCGLFSAPSVRRFRGARRERRGVRACLTTRPRVNPFGRQPPPPPPVLQTP